MAAGRPAARAAARSLAAVVLLATVTVDCSGQTSSGRPPLPPAVELPAGFPADVPRYPGARVTRASATGAATLEATFQVSDAPDRVARSYAQALVDQGWTVERRDSGGDSVLLADKDTRSLGVTIDDDSGWTRIDVYVMRRK